LTWPNSARSGESNSVTVISWLPPSIDEKRSNSDWIIFFHVVYKNNYFGTLHGLNSTVKEHRHWPATSFDNTLMKIVTPLRIGHFANIWK